MIKNDTTTYNLYSIERVYRDKTLVSFFFQKNKKVVKKFAPIDCDGQRYRANLETGEISCYKMRDVMSSHNASLRRTIIAMNMLLGMNDFDWFWTLTFDDEKIDRTNAQEVFNCYVKYINRLKKSCPSMGYMTFPEQHEDGCFHFHMLVNGITPKQMGLVDSGKVCCHWATKKNGVCSKEYFNKTKHFYTLKDTDGEPIYNVTSFYYGYTTASRICSRERCNTYVKKYVEKALGSTDIFKKRFYYSSNLNTPDVVKRLIGSDFEEPKVMTELDCIKNNKLYKHSEGIPYLSAYNVLQIKIDNQTKKFLDEGLTPIKSTSLPFNGYQEKIQI